tara:strand:+ start:596 stop:871 length:276 start_codon:yes stop_codon:yes gene_type:complete
VKIQEIIVVNVGTINIPDQSSINNSIFLISVAFIMTIKMILVVNENIDKDTDTIENPSKKGSFDVVRKAVFKPAMMALAIDMTSKTFVSLV